MMIIFVIAVICGITSLILIAKEISDAWDSTAEVVAGNTGVRRVTLLWKIPKACMPFILDIGLTLFVVWLFSMAGMMGMVLALVASAIVSILIFIKRRRSKRS